MAGPKRERQRRRPAGLHQFVSVVLARTEDTWNGVFRRMGRSYSEPKLVLFTEAVDSGCGFAESAVGPFYCPRNAKVYIDLSFYRELQADCFAGVWAHDVANARDLLEAGDVDEALRAAAAIGDDQLQMQGRGRVVPESFTHGSSAQRVRWLRQGLESGAVESCDTFNAASL